jgi:hypothetical protein
MWIWRASITPALVTLVFFPSHQIIDLNLDVHQLFEFETKADLGGFWKLRVQIQKIQQGLENSCLLAMPRCRFLECPHLFGICV